MVKILSVNIEGDKHLKEVLTLLKREHADIVCLQEVFQQDYHQLRRDLHLSGTFVAIAQINTGGPPGFNRRGLFGIALLCKRSARFGYTYYVKHRGQKVPAYNGKPNAGHRALLYLRLTNPDLTVATTHFTWSAKGRTTHMQRRELNSLFRVLERVRPTVLCGDFNAPRGGEIFDQLSTRFVDQIPKKITTTLDPTLHYSKGVDDVVVDGFFTDKNIRVDEIRLVHGVSDHQAIVATVSTKKRLSK